MDLSNGHVTEILQADYDFASYNGSYYTASVSPTGRRLAYLFNKEKPLELHVLDLQTGQDTSYSLDNKYTLGGQYHWSEDVTKLAFMLESTANYDYFISMVYVDLLQENSMVTFLDGKEYNWITSDLKVNDSGVEISTMDGDSFFYDANTGVLSTITK